MKTITLTQPWASFVAFGVKNIETRSWTTSYRGQLAIHAAKSFPAWAKQLCVHDNAIRKTLLSLTDLPAFWAPLDRSAPQIWEDHRREARDAGMAAWLASLLPRGVVIGTCSLFAVDRITAFNVPSEPERSLGDYTAGRLAFRLADAQPLPEFITWPGQLGIWDAPELESSIEALRSTRCQWTHDDAVDAVPCDEEGDLYYLPDPNRAGIIHVSRYCGLHAKPAGFCPGCGRFLGGFESFDFSPYPVCEDCREQEEAEEGSSHNPYDEDMDSPEDDEEQPIEGFNPEDL
jgi:activating signal cointegrator 1